MRLKSEPDCILLARFLNTRLVGKCRVARQFRSLFPISILVQFSHPGSRSESKVYLTERAASCLVPAALKKNSVATILPKASSHVHITQNQIVEIFMSIAREIAPHLPYLRRFARALSGSQKGGDASVIQALEAIVEDPDSFPRDIGPREALYRIFLKLWSSANSDQALPTDASTASAAERNLEQLTPRARQAFLLHSVEGFPVEIVSTILNTTEDKCRTLLEQAAREIAAQVATSVLIIEDEPIIAMDIEDMVRELGHTVTGVARTHKEAVEAIKAKSAGLVLADIQLADGSSGLEAVHEILTHINVPVIFITAYPEKLLTGDKPEPAFLITKPFQPDAVKAAISQALFFDRKAGPPSVS
jgi:CheY-like chemotaxis protein/DNA-directed RNA polymerase specialized sigma24 family protein